MEEVAFPYSSWGLQLPPATPKSTKPLPTWRPWEMEKVWQPKPQLQQFKKRSPASEARSRRRLLQWQQRRDLGRVSQELTTPLPPSRELKNVRLKDRLEGGRLGSQASPSTQWSGSQTSPSSSFWSGSQTYPSSPPLYRPGTQTFADSPSQSGSQTSPSSPPWSGDQGIVRQDYWLPASTSNNQTMLQQPLPPLVPLPSPIPGFSPPPSPTGWTRPVGGCTWGTLPALVTTCPSCKLNTRSCDYHASCYLTPSKALF